MRTGRVPESGEARGEIISVRLSKVEAAAMDRARDSESRSKFIRQAVKDRVEGRSKK